MTIIPLTRQYRDETQKDPFSGARTPYTVGYVEWLEARVYALRRKKRKPVEKKHKEPWRESFDVYKKNVIDSVTEIVNSPDKMAELQRIMPDGYDAKLSLKKAMREYWLTEDGWRKKASGKGSPDWWRTCRNIVRMQFNWVKTPRQEMVGLPA